MLYFQGKLCAATGTVLIVQLRGSASYLVTIECEHYICAGSTLFYARTHREDNTPRKNKGAKGYYIYILPVNKIGYRDPVQAGLRNYSHDS